MLRGTACAVAAVVLLGHMCVLAQQDGEDNAVLALDGTSNYARLPSFSLGNSVTVEAWYFVTSIVDDMTFFDFGGGFFHPRISLALGSEPSGTGRQMELAVDNSPSISQSGAVLTRDQFPRARWVHVAAVVDAVTSEALVFWDGKLKVSGTVPVPLLHTRPDMFIGRSTRFGAYMPGLVDDFRVWSTARSRPQINAALFTSPGTGTINLQLLLLFDTGRGGDVMLTDSSGNGRDIEDGLVCPTQSCRVRNPGAKVVCGDGVRGAGEVCDDGNRASGDGCTDACTLEPGFVCVGGGDLVSSDICEPGTTAFLEGFEDNDPSDWNPVQGVFGTWATNPDFKDEGEYGLRLKYDGRQFHGCPELLGNGVFRGGAQADNLQFSATARVVAWPQPGHSGADPKGTGFVLELGSEATRSRSVASYAVGMKAGAAVWPAGAASATYRLSAWAYVEGQFGAAVFDGSKDLLQLRLLDGVGTVVAESEDHVFPAAINVWVPVFVDLPVGTVVASAEAVFGANRGGATLGSTHGRVWVTGLSLSYHCPGLPGGPAVWLRADQGVPQVNGQRVSTWTDQSGLGVHAVAPAAENQPFVVLDGANGLPVVRFDAGETGMVLNDGVVPMRRPLTIFLVERYTPTGSHRGRLLQGMGENWLLGLHGNTHGFYTAGWVGRDADNIGNTNWEIDTGLAYAGYTEFRLTGESLGAVTNRPYDPLRLAFARLGRYNERSDADLAEMLVYRRRLSEQEVVNVEAYLGEKWGITLPATHTGVREVAEPTSDTYRSHVQQRIFTDNPATYLSWASRVLPGAVTQDMVLTLSVRLVTAPVSWGMPLWLVIQDALSALPGSHPCLVLGANCPEGHRLFRICFAGSLESACDSAIDLPVGQWVSQSRSLASQFGAKYPTHPEPLPANLVLTMGQFAYDDVAEVWVDEVSVVTVADPDAGSNCPNLVAESLDVSSRWVGVDMTPEAWVQPSGGGLTATPSAAGLAFGGTATSVLAQQAFTRDAFADNRVESFDVRIGTGTDTSAAAAPRLALCNNEVSLAYSAAADAWEYLHKTDGLERPPSVYTQVTVDDGDGPQTSWLNDRYRNAGRQVPYSETQTFSMWYKTTGVTNYWSGVFFRGGKSCSDEDVYEQPNGLRVCGGYDRKPAMWQRYRDSRLHIRMSTTASWNNGCDPPVFLDFNRWYHIALVFERKLMMVFYDGALVCRTTFGADELSPSPDRDIHFVNHQSPSSQLWLDDFRWYSTSLNAMQITRLVSEREGVSQASALSPSALLSARVTCVLSADRVQLFEDGGLKVDRPLSSVEGSGVSPLKLGAATSLGAAVDFRVSNVRVVERLSSAGVPTYCPATGHFYAMVADEAVAASQAAAAAEARTHLGVNGHLATVTSAAELECVRVLTGCDAAWVSGRRGDDGVWRLDDGPEADAPLAAFRFTHWAADEPAAGGAFMAVNADGCKGAAALGEAFACDQACAAQAVQGYVVEFESPPAHVVEHAHVDRGAAVAVAASSPLLAVGCGQYVPDCTAGPAAMADNLLRDQRVPYLVNGEADFIFGDGTAAPAWVVVDLGAEVDVNRVGAAHPQGEDARAVKDFVRVSTATASATTGPWTAWGTVGADDGSRDVYHATSWFASPAVGGAPAGAPLRVRYVRVEVGTRAGGADAGARLQRVHAQLVEATFARLVVAGVDVAPSAPGLKVATLPPASEEVDQLLTFPLDTPESLEEFAAWVHALPDDTTVMAAVSELPAQSSVLFRESFSSRQSNNDVLRQIVRDPGLGVYQLRPGITYGEAEVHCANTGARLCERQHICRPRWYPYPYGYPHYGWGADGAAYVPAGDRPDLWVAIGRAFAADSLCASYDQLHDGVFPDDVTTGRWASTVVMCCKDNPDVPPWEVHYEGVRNTTGGNHQTDRQYPGVWRILNSRLWIYGYPWGNPDNPDFSPTIRWYHERCDDIIGGTYVALEDPVARAWADYTYSFDVYANTRGVGLLVRYQDPDNYYRVFLDPEMNCGHVVRRRHGAYTRLAHDPSGSRPFHRARWYQFKTTVTGTRIRFFVNGELWFDVVDDNPDPLLTGSVAVYDWMGWTDYYDNILVETASLWSHDGNASVALRSLGAPSHTGIDQGSWAMVGRKGASSSFVPVLADRSGAPVRAQTLFRCPVQRRRVPENSRAGYSVPLPLGIARLAVADGFTVRSSTAGGEAMPVAAMAVDAATGHLFVASAALLDAEAAAVQRVSVSARSSGFDSGWFPFGSQAETLSFREVTHGLNVEPSALDASVLIRAVDGPNAGFVFRGIGNVFMTDASQWYHYGGVFFGYSDAAVRLWAPSAYQFRPSGSIINIGTGWGGVFEEGVFLEEAHAQRSPLANVRVKVRPARTADFDSGWLPMQAEAGSSSYTSLAHNLGVRPDRVRVQVKAVDGNNDGFVFEGSGSAQVDYDMWWYHYGGVVFGYDGAQVNVWAPTSRNTNAPKGNMVFVGDGWAGNHKSQQSRNALVRVQAWRAVEAPTFDSDWFDMTASGESFQEVAHGLGRVPERVSVLVQPKTGGYSDFVFEGMGMAQNVGWQRWYGYGGVVFAVNEAVVRVWAPSANPEAPWFGSAQSEAGVVYVQHGWGGNVNQVNAKLARVRVRAWVQDTGVQDGVDVDVEVVDVLEPPQADSLRVFADENRPNGTWLATLAATDGDCAAAAACNLTYAVVSGNELGALEVAPDGDVVVANQAALNWEVRDVVALVVRVSDGLLSTFASVRLDLRDINDPPSPAFGEWVSVEEEAAVNTRVGGRLNSTDEDAGQVILFSIVSGDPDGMFKIGGCDGQIRVRRPPDFETQALYRLGVNLQDDGLPPLNVTYTVDVVIINRNDPPTMAPQTLYVAENSGVGRPVGVPIAGADEDADSVLTYEVLSGDEAGQFWLNATTGQLYVARPDLLDFEAAPGDAAGARFVLQVAASDGEFSVVAPVTVVVADVNDPPTVFVSSVGGLGVDEMVGAGTVAGRLAGRDQDANDTLTFSVVSATPAWGADVFVVDPVSGVVAVRPAGDPDGLLDHETTPAVVLVVRATDAGGNARLEPAAHTLAVTLRVVNVNEAPVLSPGRFSVVENSPARTVVGTLDVVDPDVMSLPPADRGLSFTLLAGDVGGVFDVGGDDGGLPLLTVARDALNYEAVDEYALTVWVTDDGEPPLNSTATVWVTVNNTNDAPTFACDAAAAAATVVWRQDAGADAVSALLPDRLDPASAGADGSPTFAIPLAGDGNGNGNGNGNDNDNGNGSGDASDADALAACRAGCAARTGACEAFTYFYSTYPVAAFRGKCLARDSTLPVDPQEPLVYAAPDVARHLHAGLRLPVCGRVAAAEHTAASTLLLTVSATDDDGDAFTLAVVPESNPGGAVGVSDVRPVAGGGGGTEADLLVADADALNYEAPGLANHTLRVVVEAAEGGATAPAGAALFVVALTDVPEAPAWAPDETFTRNVAEGEAVGTPVGLPLVAVDPDLGAVVTYAVTVPDDDGLFDVDAATGQLRVASTLPVLSGTSRAVTLTVAADDGTGFAVPAAVTVIITDQNNPPRFTNADVPRAVDENAAAGSAVEPALAAEDPDANNGLRFGVFTGGEWFAVHPDTGAITVQPGVTLSHEDAAVRNVTVSVTDVGVDDPITVLAVVSVTVRDVAEAPVPGDAVLSLPEHATGGAWAGDAHVVWRDEDDDGVQLAFAVTSGRGDLFVVAPALDGVLAPPLYGYRLLVAPGVAAATLDFEGDDQEYVLGVSATDTTFTVASTVTVRLADVREPPVFGAVPALYVAETDRGSPGVAVGALSASDPDAGTNLTFLITENYRSAGVPVFQITSNGPFGNLTVVRGSRLNYEDVERVQVKVTVRDSRDSDVWLFQDTLVNITVANVNDVEVVSVVQGDADDLAAGVELPPAHGLATAGGDWFVVQGSNFARSSRWWAASAHAGTPRPVPTVSYGGGDGRRYAATDCQLLPDGDLDNTLVACRAAAGVGGRMRVAVTLANGDAFVSDPEQLWVSYAAPALTALLPGSGVGLRTAGGDAITLVGTNFGAGGSDGVPLLTYSIPGLTPVYRASACEVTVPHTRVSCTAAAGVGVNHQFVLAVAGQASPATELPSSYEAPAVATVAVQGGGPLLTDGGSSVVVTGGNFGPLGSHVIVGAYGPTGVEYAGVCSLTAEHAELVCDTLPGVGNDLPFTVTIAGQSSVASPAAAVSYAAPIIAASGGVTGPGAVNGSTRGEELLYVTGAHFGPLALPASVTAEYVVRYGAAATAPAFEFVARNCTAVEPEYGRLRCVSAPGTGQDHHWSVETRLCSAVSPGVCVSQVSAAVAAGTAYGAPVVGNVFGAGAYSDTPGGMEVVVQGVNFGHDPSRITRVEYRRVVAEDDGGGGGGGGGGGAAAAGGAASGSGNASTPTPVFVASDCVLVVPHEELRCTTAPGAGKDLSWRVVVDGQNSISPTYAYLPPIVYSVSGAGAVNASTAGDQVVVLAGDNFGPGDGAAMLQRVTYGAGGDKYVARSCSVTVPHTEITCRTAPGVGAGLWFTVTVQEQVSTAAVPPLGYVRPSMSYAPPVVAALVPLVEVDAATGYRTEGGVRMRLVGTNFGPAGDDVWVMFGSSPQPCPDAVLTLGAVGGGGSAAAAAAAAGCVLVLSAQHQEVVWETPPGQGTGFRVAVSAGGVASNALPFSYSPPTITRMVVKDPVAGVTTITLTGVNFGVFGDVLVRPILAADDDFASVFPLVPVPATDAYTHTSVTFSVATMEGRVNLVVGGQPSLPRVFTQASPEIHSLAASRTAPTGTPAVGSTRGLFTLTFTGSNLGKVRPRSARPSVEALVGGVLCDMNPLVGDFAPDGTFVPNPAVYTVLGNNISNGTVSCVVAAGQGAGLPVVLRHEHANDTSDPVPFSFNPPTSVRFVGAGDAVFDARAGDVLTLSGTDLGTSADVVLADAATGAEFRVPATFVQPHDVLTFEVPQWQGTVRVAVDVSGQRSADDLVLQYAPPALDVGFRAAVRPTQGAWEVEIEGDNFGQQFAVVGFPPEVVVVGYVTVGGVVADCHVWTNTRIVCSVPASQGRDQAVVVHAGGQQSVPDVDDVVAYDPPTVDEAATGGPWAFNTSAGGAVLTVVGANFGLNASGRVVVGDRWWHGNDSSVVAAWGHTAVALRVPDGAGANLPVAIVAGNQATPASAAMVLSYHAPWVAGVTPAQVPVDGCFRWEPVTSANGGEDPGTGRPLRMCCQPALVTVTGANFGPPGGGVAVTLDDGTPLAATCDDAVAVGAGQPGAKHTATVGRACPAACDDQVFREENVGVCAPDDSDATAEPCCVYSTFPFNAAKEADCACPVPATPCILSASHTHVSFRPPLGFGQDVPLVVRVGGQASVGATVSFEPPVVERVVQTPYDARLGSQLTLYGRNFGFDNRNVTVLLDDVECESPALLVKDGLSSLRCDAGPDVAGPKNITVAIDGVVGFHPAEGRGTGALAVAACSVGDWGRVGEVCLLCNRGAVCPGRDAEPFSDVGWWMQRLTGAARSSCNPERQAREACPHFIPCEPKDACLGNNVCAEGYEGDRCSQCVKGEFYRLDGECVRCPDNAWVLIVAAIVAACALAACAYFLTRRNINIGIISIMIDYFQVLALFARSKVEWPPIIKRAFQIMSAFNLNLELTAPECSFPDLSYEMKWYAVMGLPLVAVGMFSIVYLTLVVWKRCVLRQKAEVGSHAAVLISAALTMFYILYLYLSRTTFDIFNCVPTDPPDGQKHGYMQAVFEPCFVAGGMHVRLFPLALATLFVYVIGFPLFCGYILLRNRLLVQEDQLLRAEGLGFTKNTNPNAYIFRRQFQRIYYNFRPERYFWILVIIARKFLIAITALMFIKNAAFQLSLALLVMFTAYTLQVQNRPYMGQADYPATLKQHAEAAKKGNPLHKTLAARVAAAKKNMKKKTRGTALAARRPHDNAAAAYVFNYNTVEGTLLSCAVFITLSGIMFESNRFDDDFYAVQRDVLAVLVMIVIVVSVAYVVTVLVYDLLATFKPQLFKGGNNKNRRLRFAAAQAAKEEKVAKSRLVIQNNPMMDNRLNTIEGSTMPQSAPTPALWAAFRETYTTMEATLQGLKETAAQRDVAEQAAAPRQRRMSNVGRRRPAFGTRKKKAQFTQARVRGDSTENPGTAASGAAAPTASDTDGSPASTARLRLNSVEGRQRVRSRALSRSSSGRRLSRTSSGRSLVRGSSGRSLLSTGSVSPRSADAKT